MGTKKHAQFKRGDVVTWTSQASGYIKKKTGKVVEVVKPNNSPRWDGYKGSSGVEFNRDYGMRCSASRDHRSYVVDVDGKLYWPLVKNLKLVKGTVS